MKTKSTKSPLILFAAGALFLHLAYAQFTSWGKYTPTILKVKTASFFGVATLADYQNLGEACLALKNSKCTSEAYTRVYQTTRDPELIGRIAYTYLQTKEYKEAEHTYMLYFRAGGRSAEQAFNYGVTLEQLGIKDRALRAYEMSLGNRKLKSTRLAQAAVKRLSGAAKNYGTDRNIASERKSQSRL